MIVEQGLNGSEFKELKTLINKANIEQLNFIIAAIETQIIKKNNQ